jgi:hypothetical protein
MQRSVKAALAAGLLGGTLVVAGPASPALAGVGAGTSGTQINVIITGNATVGFACSGGKAAITSAGTTTVLTPNLACSAVTKVVVAGDGGNQTIDGRGLDGAAFSAHPYLVASLAAGNDDVWDTARADDLTLGQGYDHLILNPSSVANTSVDLGTGGAVTEVDAVEAYALPTGGSMTASTPGDGDLVVTETNASGTHTNTIAHAEFMWFEGGAGNDTMNAAGLTTGSAVDQLRFDAGGGNDTMTSGQVGASLMFGNAGANTFNTGSGFTNVVTDSDTDTVHLGGPAVVLDTLSLRSGGRTVTSSAGNQGWSLNLPHGDAVAHARPGAGGATVLTTTLDRFGQQTLPSPVNDLGIGLYDSGVTNPSDHGLIDVVAQAGKAFTISGVAPGGPAGNIADVLIPSGSWATTGSVGTSSTLTITPNGGYGKITIKQMSAAAVHGPWSSANESFAHRVVRDLLFRIPSDGDRNLVKNQLDAHTKTRAQIVAGIMDTDEYRSLDVNRTFLDFLKRAADPGGQAYWVNSLANGKSLRQFRSQLFGSNEYFTKAGGTNLGFLLHAYEDVFGRLPDPGGQAYWLNRLNTGTERGRVARAFLASTEARRTIVREQFLRFVVRFPTTNELDHWIPLLDGATGEQDLIAALVNSSAYYAEP